MAGMPYANEVAKVEQEIGSNLDDSNSGSTDLTTLGEAKDSQPVILS